MYQRTFCHRRKYGTVWKNVCKGNGLFHLWTTTYEVILGFVIGAFLGIVLGYIFIKVDALKTMLMPYLIFLQTAPKIALVPLFVIWVRDRTCIKSCPDHFHGTVSGIVRHDAGIGIDPAGCQKPDEDLKGIKMADLFTG